MPRVAIAVTAATLALAGCGGDDKAGSPATEVSKTVDVVKSTALAGNAGKMCNELFTPALRIRVQTQEKKPCEQTVKARLLPALTAFKVNSIQLQSGDKRAVVDLTDRNKQDEKLYMANDGGWKIEGVLKPGAGTQSSSGK